MNWRAKRSSSKTRPNRSLKPPRGSTSVSRSQVSTVSTKNSVEVAHDALATRGLQLLSVELHVGSGREDEIGHFFDAFLLAEIVVIQTVHAAKHHFRFDLRSSRARGGHLEGVGGALVLNQCDLRGLEVREIVHHHDAPVGVPLHKRAVGGGREFRNAVRKRDEVRLLRNPGDLQVRRC